MVPFMGKEAICPFLSIVTKGSGKSKRTDCPATTDNGTMAGKECLPETEVGGNRVGKVGLTKEFPAFRLFITS